MSTAAFANPVLRDLTRDRLRVEHRVRTLQSEEEGAAFDHLPNGVYGFTYAPATETPLFAKPAYHSFEVHKLADGSGRLLVYCTPDDASRIAGGEVGEMMAYPDAWENATVLVAVPLERVMNSLYKPVRRDGNAVPLRVG
jgi:hypothetical protein